MEVQTYRIRYRSRSDEFALWFLGDLHVGAATCDESAIRAVVRKIKSDATARWVALGDLAEFIPRADWRFRQSRLADWLRGLDADYCDDIVERQIARIVELLSPVAAQCLGAVYGNHESKMLERFERDVHRAVCRELKIADLGAEALIRIVYHRGAGKAGDATALDLYCHHGWFASRKPGAGVNNLQDIFLAFDADIAAVGHGHNRLVAPPVIQHYITAAGELGSRRKIALMTGSFAAVRDVHKDTYASERGYRTADGGAVCVVFRPSTRNLSVMI